MPPSRHSGQGFQPTGPFPGRALPPDLRTTPRQTKADDTSHPATRSAVMSPLRLSRSRNLRCSVPAATSRSGLPTRRTPSPVGPCPRTCAPRRDGQRPTTPAIPPSAPPRCPRSGFPGPGTSVAMSPSQFPAGRKASRTAPIRFQYASHALPAGRPDGICRALRHCRLGPRRRAVLNGRANAGAAAIRARRQGPEGPAPPAPPFRPLTHPAAFGQRPAPLSFRSRTG